MGSIGFQTINVSPEMLDKLNLSIFCARTNAGLCGEYDCQELALLIKRSPVCYASAAIAVIPAHSIQVFEGFELRYLRLNDKRFVVQLRPIADKAIEPGCQKVAFELVDFWEAKGPYFFQHWLAWFFDTSEMYSELELVVDNGQSDLNPKWSPLLCIVGLVLFLLRRLSFYEIVKHFFPSVSGANKTPARLLDFYLLFVWAGIGMLTFVAGDLNCPRVMFWALLFLIVQVIQTSFYHEFWRTLGRSKVESERFVYSRLRNLLIGVANIIVVCWCFGLVYFFGNCIVNSSGGSVSVQDSIFFSFTVGWSVGPIGKQLSLRDSFECLAMLQIGVTLFLISVVLGIVVAGIAPLKEIVRTGRTD